MGHQSFGNGGSWLVVTIQACGLGRDELPPTVIAMHFVWRLVQRCEETAEPWLIFIQFVE